MYSLSSQEALYGARPQQTQEFADQLFDTAYNLHEFTSKGSEQVAETHQQEFCSNADETGM